MTFQLAQTMIKEPTGTPKSQRPLPKAMQGPNRAVTRADETVDGPPGRIEHDADNQTERSSHRDQDQPVSALVDAGPVSAHESQAQWLGTMYASAAQVQRDAAAQSNLPASAPSAESTPAAAAAPAHGLIFMLFGLGLVSWVNQRDRTPTVSITLDDPVLSQGEQGTVRFDFDRPVQNFDLSDVEISGGSLSNLRPTDDPTVFLATLVADAEIQARADGGFEIEISIASGSYMGATGGEGQGTRVGLDADNVAPRASLFSTLGVVTAGSRTRIDLVFSEPVTGLDPDDLIATEGRIENLSVTASNANGVPIAYRMDFVADSADFEPGAARVALRAGSYTDPAGNAGGAASTVVDIRTPSLQSVNANAASDTIAITYDLALDASSVATPDRFEVYQGGRAITVAQVSVQSSTLTLTVPGLDPGAFSLSYRAPTGSDGDRVIQSASGIDAGGFFRGLVADGYVAGARIYLDDGDGVFEPGIDLDTGALTAGDGSFVLSGQWLNTMAREGRSLIALGGTNIDTGVANTITMAAPSGATVINPLTTLAQGMIAGGEASNLDEATALIVAGLGLSVPQGVSLANFDPIAGAARGDAAALAAQKIAAQVATLLTLAQTQQTNAVSGEAAERGLAQALIDAIVERAEAIAAAPAGQSAPATLDLSNTQTLSSLSARAETITSAQGMNLNLALPSDAEQTLGSIGAASDLQQVGRAQQQGLGELTLASPVLKTLLPSLNGLTDRALIELPSISGTSGLRAGDRIDLVDPQGGVITSHTLSADDLAAGELRVAIDARGLDLTGVGLQVVDSMGNTSETVTSAAMKAPAVEGDVLDLGAMLTPLLQSALQGVANINVPFVGSLAGMIDNSGLALWLEDLFANLPKLRLMAGPRAAQQGSPTLKSVDDNGFYFGIDEPDSGSGDTSGGGDDSGWVINPDPDSGGYEGGGESGDGGFEDLDPPGGSDDNDGVAWDPADGSNADAYRFTGPQINLPLREQNFNYDAATGEFELVIIEPDEWFNEGFGGMIGGDGATGFVDANLAGHHVWEIRLFGKVQYELDAYKLVTLDTVKSGIKLHADLGVATGSTIGGVLGPFSLVGQDKTSQYASDTALRKNTGIEGGVTVSFKDFDGTNDKRLSLIKGLDVFLGKVVKDPLKALGDVFDLRANLEGRLSVQADLGLNFGNVATNTSLGPILDLFALNLGADITTPLRLVYDSTDASKNVSDWGTIHLDNATVSLAPLITQASGSAIKTIDSVMAPIYAIENFFSYELPFPDAIGDPIAPLDLPSWMPGFAKDFINQLVNAPRQALNGIVDQLVNALDIDNNGKVTVLEAIEQSARHYFEFVKFADQLWDTMIDLSPGLKDTLTASGYGTAVVAIMESLEAQKQIFAAFFDYFDYFKTGLEVIDGLEQLSTLHAAAAAQIAAQQSTLLALPIGSFKWDIPEGEFNSTSEGNSYNLIQRVLPPRSDPEPNLSSAEAIQRLIDAAVGNQVNELGTGAGGLHEYVYFHAGVPGVTRDNLQTINSLLDAKPIRDWIHLRDPRFDNIRPGAFEDDPDYGVRVVGKLQEVVEAWRLIERVGVNRASPEDKANLHQAFAALELTTVKSEILPSYQTMRARALLLSIIENQTQADLDSYAELKGLIDAWSAWTATTPLTRDQLKLLRIELLSEDTGPESHLAQVNAKIKNYFGDFATYYSEVRKYATDLNAAWIKATEAQVAEGAEGASTGELLVRAAYKIRDAAESNTVAQTLTLDDFKKAGISGLTTQTLPGFASFLDSTVLGKSHTGKLSDIQKLVNAYNFVLETAGAKLDTSGTKPKQFYDAIDLLLQGGRATEMEHIPYATTRVGARPSSVTPTLPFLQSIIATRSDDQVDTYAELDAIACASREVLMLSMADKYFWNKSHLLAVKPWSSNRDALDPVITKYKEYKSTTLTADSLKLIGFDGGEGNALTALETKLDAYRKSAFTFVSVSNKDIDKWFKTLPPTKPLTASELAIAAAAAPAEDQISKLLESVPNVKKFWDALKNAGVEFPIVNSIGKDLAEAIIDNELMEVFRFTPKLPAIEDLQQSYEYNLAQLLPFYEAANAVVPFSLPVSLDAGVSIIPRLSIGADTYWLQSIRNGEGRNFFELLANSVYLIDEYEVDGAIVDLPELEIDLSLGVSAGAMIGKSNGLANLYAEIFGGLALQLEADLNGDMSGKLRLADLLGDLLDFPEGTGIGSVIASGQDNLFAMLGDNILDIINFKGALDLNLGGELGLNVDLTPEDTSDLGAVTKALSDAYKTAADWLKLETQFNKNIGVDFTIPIFNFDTSTGSLLFNV